MITLSINYELRLNSYSAIKILLNQYYMPSKEKRIASTKKPGQYLNRLPLYVNGFLTP